MKRFVLHHSVIALCLASAVLAAPTRAAGFTLSSPEVAPDARIADRFAFKGFGCDGGNLSPALEWHGAPAGTRSYALTVYDPDAPTGSGWWHWVVVNLPAGTTGLPEGAGAVSGGDLPPGSRQLRTDFGTAGYGGPCPPVGHGPHRYVFTVYALKLPMLELPVDATAALAGYMINANTLGSATFTGIYERK